MWWSPCSTMLVTRHSTAAGAASRIGAPVEPLWMASPESLPSSSLVGLKKVNATPLPSLPRMFNANVLVFLTMPYAPESVLTPTTTRGGAKAVCVTQLTVAAATLPLPSSADSTKVPQGAPLSAGLFVSWYTLEPPSARLRDIINPAVSHQAPAPRQHHHAVP